MRKSQNRKPKRGRPITRKIEIHATAEEIARAMFAAAKPPDPSKRAKSSTAIESTERPIKGR